MGAGRRAGPAAPGRATRKRAKEPVRTMKRKRYRRKWGPGEEPVQRPRGPGTALSLGRARSRTGDQQALEAAGAAGLAYRTGSGPTPATRTVCA